MPKGFKITKTIIDGVRKILTFKPQKMNTDLAEELPTAIQFFNDSLYQLPDNDKKCLQHFHKLYENLPKKVDYYFRIEKFFDKEGNLVKEYCDPIGSGESPADALSTYLLTDRITETRPNTVLTNKDGHFIKVYFTEDELNYEQIEVIYGETIRESNRLFRNKVKKMTLQSPFGDTEIPESLEYSSYWLKISNKYQDAINEQKIADEINDLNKRFREAEKQFYDSIKLYNEYKQRLADAQKNSALIDMMLQGANIALSIYNTKDEYSNRMIKIDKNIDDLKKEIGSIKSFANSRRNSANNIIINIRNTFIKNNIPINDDPRKDDIWKEILD